MLEACRAPGMYVERRVVAVAERDYWNVAAARTEPDEGWDRLRP